MSIYSQEIVQLVGSIPNETKVTSSSPHPPLCEHIKKKINPRPYFHPYVSSDEGSRKLIETLLEDVETMTIRSE